MARGPGRQRHWRCCAGRPGLHGPTHLFAIHCGREPQLVVFAAVAPCFPSQPTPPQSTTGFHRDPPPGSSAWRPAGSRRRSRLVLRSLALRVICRCSGPEGVRKSQLRHVSLVWVARSTVLGRGVIGEGHVWVSEEGGGLRQGKRWWWSTFGGMGHDPIQDYRVRLLLWFLCWGRSTYGQPPASRFAADATRNMCKSRQSFCEGAYRLET